MQIILPKAFTAEYQDVLTRYLVDDRLLNPAEWRLLYQGIDILNTARIQTDAGAETFRQAYHHQIDAGFATPYLERLLALEDVETQSPALIAEFARRIAPHLQQAGLLRPDVPSSRLLYVYCIYWWQSFARGYAFEVQIVRDLQASGIEFYSHDVRDPVERRSVADLVVLNLMGDVKTSTYFLKLAASHGLPNDFYVTRIWTGRRHRPLVVFQKPAAWKKINGDTVEGELSDLLHLLPRPVKLQRGDVTLIAIDYAAWKQRVLQVQQEESE